MTEHPLTGLFRVLHENIFEGEQHKTCMSQMVGVTGVHNDAYIEKTSVVAQNCMTSQDKLL